MTIRSIYSFARVAAVLVTATGLLASTGMAEARPNDDCSMHKGFLGCNGGNGTKLTGIRIDDNPLSARAEAVTLPSGEIVRLGANAGEQPRLQVAAGCTKFICGDNGTQLTGISIDDNPSGALAEGVTLPSGEIVRLGANAGEQPRLQVARGGCDSCGENGTQLTGIRIDDNRSGALTEAVTLPSGEIVRLGANAGE
jgi:hypothetical protein